MTTDRLILKQLGRTEVEKSASCKIIEDCVISPLEQRIQNSQRLFKCRVRPPSVIRQEDKDNLGNWEFSFVNNMVSWVQSWAALATSVSGLAHAS